MLAQIRESMQWAYDEIFNHEISTRDKDYVEKTQRKMEYLTLIASFFNELDNGIIEAELLKHLAGHLYLNEKAVVEEAE